MNMKRERMKAKIFLGLYIIFVVLTFVGGFLVITKKLGNAGYSVVPMLFALLFSVFYRNRKKAIDENSR